jgi:hypothetical protein
MAVVALPALGMLTVLAGGLSTKVTTVAEPKATFGVCMGIHAAFGRIDDSTTRFCVGVALPVAFGVDTASPHWWRQLEGRRLSVVLGERMLTALRLARFASWAAGPLGFTVMTL